MSDLAIKVQNLSKKYRLGNIGGKTLREDLSNLKTKIFGKQKNTVKSGEFFALENISFEVKKGEILGIIGHNGAGKSTLLKLLSRITTQESGEIMYNGKISSLLEIGTGFHPELTGRENVYLSGAILGMTKAEINKKFDDIVAFSNLSEFIDTPVKRYSSGMYVRLAFAVAVHLDSEILIMDEVLAVGDASFQEKCINKMGDIASGGKRTILYVSHNMSSIKKLCDRCIVLDHGKLIFDGEPEKAIEVYIDKNFNNESEADLSVGDRSDLLLDDSVRLTYAKYLDKENCVFNKGEKIKILTKIDSKIEKENVCVRFVVRKFDETPITVAFGENLSLIKGKNDYNLEIDVSMLSEGRYKTYYVIYEKGKTNESKNLDSVRGLDFAITDKNIKDNLSWREKAWGAFELPKIKVEKNN